MYHYFFLRFRWVLTFFFTILPKTYIFTTIAFYFFFLFCFCLVYGWERVRDSCKCKWAVRAGWWIFDAVFVCILQLLLNFVIYMHKQQQKIKLFYTQTYKHLHVFLLQYLNIVCNTFNVLIFCCLFLMFFLWLYYLCVCVSLLFVYKCMYFFLAFIIILTLLHTTNRDLLIKKRHSLKLFFQKKKTFIVFSILKVL